LLPVARHRSFEFRLLEANRHLVGCFRDTSPSISGPKQRGATSLWHPAFLTGDLDWQAFFPLPAASLCFFGSGHAKLPWFFVAPSA